MLRRVVFWLMLGCLISGGAAMARAEEQAAKALADRLSQYEKPAIDQGLVAALADFVRRRKQG
jgi:trimethylamine:corrinoid methyltransferase-like protein